MVYVLNINGGRVNKRFLKEFVFFLCRRMSNNDIDWSGSNSKMLYVYSARIVDKLIRANNRTFWPDGKTFKCRLAKPMRSDDVMCTNYNNSGIHRDYYQPSRRYYQQQQNYYYTDNVSKYDYHRDYYNTNNGRSSLSRHCFDAINDSSKDAIINSDKTALSPPLYMPSPPSKTAATVQSSASDNTLILPTPPSLMTKLFNQNEQQQLQQQHQYYQQQQRNKSPTPPIATVEDNKKNKENVVNNDNNDDDDNWYTNFVDVDIGQDDFDSMDELQSHVQLLKCI